VWNNLGTILEVRERAREALEAYRRAEHFAPDEPLILHNIALLLYRMERHADAISAWYRLIEVDPSLAEPHFALGNIHMDRGHFVDAAICFVKAADLDPDRFQAYSNLGAALLEVGQISGAESAFERAVSLHPSAVDYFNLAKT
jgi:Flp pilus assembly protein TadD